MRTGRRLAIDVGKARIGVAVSDFHGILASPLGNVHRDESSDELVRAWRSFLELHDTEIGSEFLEIYVGLPISLNGADTASTHDAIQVGLAFAECIGLEPRFIDERLTTVSAAANLRAVGKSAKSSKAQIDSVAASLILEAALNSEKNTGLTPGLTKAEVTDR